MSQSDQQGPKDIKSEHDSYLEDTEDESFQCPICLGKLQYPVLLPCSHTICYNCLVQYLDSHNLQASPRCPTCRSLFDMKEIRNIQIGKKDGKDPRPKNYDQRFEQQFIPQHDQQMGLQFNINGFQFQIPLGRQVVRQRQQLPNQQLTKAEKIKKYCIMVVFFIIFIAIIASMIDELQDGATIYPNTHYRIFYI